MMNFTLKFMNIINQFLSAEILLWEVLNPAAEQIQHAKKQREQIYDDKIYFTSSKPPENAPEWAYNKKKIYDKTDTETQKLMLPTV